MDNCLPSTLRKELLENLFLLEKELCQKGEKTEIQTENVIHGKKRSVKCTETFNYSSSEEGETNLENIDSNDETV